jgi:hypothetical protein
MIASLTEGGRTQTTPFNLSQRASVSSTDDASAWPASVWRTEGRSAAVGSDDKATSSRALRVVIDLGKLKVGDLAGSFH